MRSFALAISLLSLLMTVTCFVTLGPGDKTVIGDLQVGSLGASSLTSGTIAASDIASDVVNATTLDVSTLMYKGKPIDIENLLNPQSVIKRYTITPTAPRTVVTFPFPSSTINRYYFVSAEHATPLLAFVCEETPDSITVMTSTSPDAVETTASKVHLVVFELEHRDYYRFEMLPNSKIYRHSYSAAPLIFGSVLQQECSPTKGGYMRLQTHPTVSEVPSFWVGSALASVNLPSNYLFAVFDDNWASLISTSDLQIGFSPNQSNDVKSVTFPTPFDTVPTVVLTCVEDNGSGNTASVILEVTTTGFTFSGFHGSAVYGDRNTQYSWMAVARDTAIPK